MMLARVLILSGLSVALLVGSALEAQDSAPQYSYPVRADVLSRVAGSEMQVARQHGAEGRSEGAYFLEATWRNDYKDDFLTCNFPAETSDWTRGFFIFVPSADGKVQLVFRGRLEKDEFDNHIAHWVAVDEVEIDGGKGVNLNFNDMDDFGVPSGWKVARGQGTDGRGGGKAVKVWFRSPISQEIEVEAGKPVTVSFWYRPLIVE